MDTVLHSRLESRIFFQQGAWTVVMNEHLVDGSKFTN